MWLNFGQYFSKLILDEIVNYGMFSNEHFVGSRKTYVDKYSIWSVYACYFVVCWSWPDYGQYICCFLVTTSSSTTGNGTSGKKQGKTKSGGASAKKVGVNESQMDLLLEMLQTADITSTDPEENKTLLQLEGNQLSLPEERSFLYSFTWSMV